MNVALFSTAYFPPVAYMTALLRQGTVLIEHKETFPKQTYRNRAVIMTAGGLRALTVPVVRDNHSRTDEVAVDYRTRWNVVHLRTLAAAYAASPYYLYYQDELEYLLLSHYDRLIDLNDAVLRWLLRRLKVDCQHKSTTDYCPSDGDPLDFRNSFSPKVPWSTDGYPTYCQVFADRLPFEPNLSIIDLLMNLGPDAHDYLERIPLRNG